MTDAWRPMGQPTDDAPHEGVPEWLEPSLTQWLRPRLFGTARMGGLSPREDVIAKYERLRRGRTNLRAAVRNGWQSVLGNMDDDDVLVLLDFLVADSYEGSALCVELEEILLEGGSAWRVGNRGDFLGLERRLPEGVQAAGAAAMATPGHAGSRLAEAWRSAYGVSPNPTHAYAMAVKAVEDAAIPKVVPNQSAATLGHVIGQLRSDANWSLPLTREDPSAPTSETIVRMSQALWKGHHDRHGGVAAAPQLVSQEEAEAAVQIAVFLVHGFATGSIARR